MCENTIITNMTPVTAEINLWKVLHFLQMALDGIQEKLKGLFWQNFRLLGSKMENIHIVVKIQSLEEENIK